MTDRDFEYFWNQLAGLWPEATMTAEEAALWRERVMPLPLAVAMDALKELRVDAVNRRRPDVGAFLAKVKVRQRGIPVSRREQSVADVLRTQGVGDGSMTDVDIVIEHHRRLWRLHGSGPDDQASRRRCQLQARCINILCAMGVGRTEATRMTEAIFGRDESDGLAT